MDTHIHNWQKKTKGENNEKENISPATWMIFQVKTFNSKNNFTTTIFCPGTILIRRICWTRTPFRRCKCSTITSQNTATISYYRKSICLKNETFQFLKVHQDLDFYILSNLHPSHSYICLSFVISPCDIQIPVPSWADVHRSVR